MKLSAAAHYRKLKGANTLKKTGICEPRLLVRHDVDAVPVFFRARDSIFPATVQVHARGAVVGPALQQFFKDDLSVLPSALAIAGAPLREKFQALFQSRR